MRIVDSIERRVLAQRQRDVLADRQRRQQRAALERHADAPVQVEHLALARVAKIDAEQLHRAAARPLQAEQVAQQRDLPEPDPPMITRISPGLTEKSMPCSTRRRPYQASSFSTSMRGRRRSCAAIATLVIPAKRDPVLRRTKGMVPAFAG